MTTIMGKASSFSMLAETAEEFIQLECTRRRNQASLKRQSLLPSQLHVTGHKSRLKEKLAQARRHSFLLRADNKAALVRIIDDVRDLANNDEGGNASQRNGPSPLQRDRFTTWAIDVEKLLFEFEPSENHEDDPVLRLLEYLQFLQDGHVCLAEVVMDARALLERWDRAGLFDSDSSSEEDDNDDRTPQMHHFIPSDPAKENFRRLQQSYAYQNVRQRAAASIIKRNVLAWVRSKTSFCDRVAEIEIFGRTTEALLKELSLTSTGHANSNGNADIFTLATGRPKSRYSGRIAFKDLLQFSKHMALYPVDQALRTVEDVTRRRYLFDSRCALKIQSVWRGVREAVRARRLRRAVEEIRLRREQEAQAKRDAAKESKKRKALEAGKRKSTRTFKRTSTARPSVIASAMSKLDETSTTLVDDDPPKGLVSSEIRESPTKRKSFAPAIDTSYHRTGARGSTLGLNDRLKSPTSTPRSRHRTSRIAVNNDSDEDTTDVEAAWKSFMDTVGADTQETENLDEIERNALSEVNPPRDPTPLATLLPKEDTWEAWSDDELDNNNDERLETEDKLGRPPTPPTPITPLAPISPMPKIKVVVSVNKTDSSQATIRRAFQRKTMTPRRNETRPLMNTSAARPPSSLPSDATLHNHTGPYTGAGQLSLMAPFIDADRSKKAQPTVLSERKHLYDLDFNGLGKQDASFAHMTRVFNSSQESEIAQMPSKPKTPEKLGVERPRPSGRTKTIARLRTITGEPEQNARVHNSFEPENQQSDDKVSQNDKSNELGSFIYGPQGTNFRREMIIRKGTMVYSPLSGPPEDNATNSNEPGAMDVKTWRRSTITAAPGGPHRPVHRFRPRQKRRMKGPQHATIITTSIVDQIQDVSLPANNKPDEKHDELPLLLYRSREVTRRREVENLPDKDNQETSTLPAPDVTKQMWKRGEELPELMLAHIRDRIGYKRKSSRLQRLSIIAGRAPQSPGTQIDGGLSTLSATMDETSMSTTSVRADTGETDEEQHELMYPVDEESDEDDYSDSASTDKDNDSSDEADNGEDVQSWDNGLCNENGELNEEIQQLQLASRDRKISSRRSMLIQLQSEENAAIADDTRRRSKDVAQLKHKRMGKRHSQMTCTFNTMGEMSDVPNQYDVDISTLHYGLSDDDKDTHRRRKLRIKTRDAKVGPFAGLSDDDEDIQTDVDELNVNNHLGMTEQERDAAFQKLLTQYLGLLQCTPAEVARRLRVHS